MLITAPATTTAAATGATGLASSEGMNVPTSQSAGPSRPTDRSAEAMTAYPLLVRSPSA